MCAPRSKRSRPIRTATAIAHVAAPPRPLWRRAIPIVATAIVAGALTGCGRVDLGRSTPPAVARFTLMLPEGQQFTNPGRQRDAISPDGTQIVVRGQPAVVPPTDVGVGGEADSGHGEPKEA